MKRIRTLEQLAAAVEKRQSVLVPNYHWTKRHNPAAWMINLNGYTLLNMFRSGMFIYNPQPRPATKKEKI